MSTSDTTTAADALPDYAPIPESSFGPALNDQGYAVGRVERNLYWVTDGVYQAAFLTTQDGVVHFPEHDTLMMVDIVNSGWVPVYVVNLSDDIPGYLGMPATALTYPWKTLISGHLGRLGTREDVIMHQRYMADLEASARIALDTVDPTPYLQKGGANVWAGVKGYLNAVGEATAAPVIEKYTG